MGDERDSMPQEDADISWGLPFPVFRGGPINDWVPEDQYGPHPAFLDDEVGDADCGLGPAPPPLATIDDDEHPACSPELELAEKPVAGAGTKASALVVTERDVEILRFLVRYRMATYVTLAKRFETSVNAMRQRVVRLHAAGYVHKESPCAPAVAVWLPTVQGVRLAKLPFSVPAFRWAKFKHTLGIASLGADLEVSGRTVVTETEFQYAVSKGGEGYRNLPLSALTHNGRSHLPDLLVQREDGWWDAIEHELTRKSPAELRRILVTYLRSTAPVVHVTYYCDDRDVAVGVAKAAKEVGADHMVAVKRYRKNW